MTKSEKPRRGCKCRCGESTSATYRPGHDARHVSRLYDEFTQRRNNGEHAYDVYLSVFRQLPSKALRRKLRTRLIARYGGTNDARSMVHTGWQDLINLRGLIRSQDEEIDVTGSISDVAAVAAMLGWNMNSVNRRRS
jgi:hypothetical protein